MIYDCYRKKHVSGGGNTMFIVSNLAFINAKWRSRVSLGFFLLGYIFFLLYFTHFIFFYSGGGGPLMPHNLDFFPNLHMSN